jgi:xanthine dehydrogenase/oxidase
VFFALREAVKDARRMNGQEVGGEGAGRWKLDSPATAERLRLAVGDDLVRRAEVKRKEGEHSFLVSVS